MNGRLAAIAIVLLAGCSASTAAPDPTRTIEPRPAASTACERAYAAMAYAWDDRAADATAAADPFKPDAMKIATFHACSLADLQAAAKKFLIHQYEGHQGALTPYWSPSDRRLKIDDCSYAKAADTKLCREVLK